MSLGFTPVRRRFERLLATLSAVAVLMSIMVVFAPAALAHHPEITANQTCVDQEVSIAYESVSWKTDGTPGSGHSDIRIEVRVNGSGTWAEVANGAFNAGNNYRFSGTFDAAPYWGESIEVQARAVGPWDNGNGGGETRVTNPFLVIQDCFNPSCPSQYLEYKVEPVTAGVHGTFFTISNIQDNGSGQTFDWSSTRPVFQVIVKGGPGANIYDYPGGDQADTGLHAPLNPSNDKWYGLSHITFCYGDPEPDPVEVTPDPQVCGVVLGLPQGAISFNIDPSSGATVQVYANSNFTGPIGGALGDGVSLPLAPGTYYWQATAGDGFEIGGAASGEFTIVPCEASTVVVSGECVVGPNGAPLGQAQVTIDPTSGATVVITGPGGPYDFSGAGGSQALAPGEYSWQATAAPGFALTGPSSGQFTIDPCTGSVTVTSGACDLLDGPLGPVDVTIAPDDAATVTIYSDEAMTDEVVSFGDEGGSTNLAPGTYYWEAVAESGFDLEGPTQGEFTIQPCAASTVVVSEGCELNEAGLPVGLVEVTIDPDSGATVVVSGPGGPYDFSGSGGSQELAPGSYGWEATAAAGFALSGETSGEFDIEPCDVSVLVANGECQLVDGPLGSVTVFIDADSGAMVTVYDAELNVAAAFNEVGGTTNLVPGTYTWVAVPGDGFEFPQDQATSGEFTIAPCPSTVLMTQGACVVGDGPLGSVLAEIDPDAGATVTLRDADLNVVATFTGTGGSIDLAPGSYTWTVEAADGFAVVGETTGQMTIESCGASVLVTHGNCVVGAPTAFGSVTVGIAPEAAASVTIFDSSHLEVAVFGDAGGQQALLFGDYTWSAVATPGYDLTGSTTGAFEVVACPDEVGGVSILPFTGMDSETLLGVSILLLGMGIYLIHIARRGEEG